MQGRIMAGLRSVRSGLPFVVILAAGCATAGLETSALAPIELGPLGTPTRTVRFEGGARTADAAALEVYARAPLHENGSIPVIIHPSEKAVVEVVYQLVPSEQACRSALEAYHKRLVVEQGDRIRHRLSCVNIADGKVTNATTIAATF